MMATLYFAILCAATGVILEEGTVRARTCEAAVQHVQGGLLPHQVLDVDVCVEVGR